MSWQPALYRRHRGYFLVAMGLGMYHLIEGFDSVMPGAHTRHLAHVWHYSQLLVNDSGWGALHFACAAMLGYGSCFGEAMWPVRVASAASVSVFTLLLASFLWAAFRFPDVSYFGISACVFVLFCSIATLLEPGENPAYEAQRKKEQK